jgi:hypothetical protein
MKYLYLLLATFSMGICSWAQTANVQIIHNAATPGNAGGQAIDIYVNGLLPPALADLSYREASSFLPFPADAALEISIALSPSNSVDDAIASFSPGALEAGENYILMATGIPGNTTYPLQLALKAGARLAAEATDSVDVLMFNGAVELPSLRLHNRTFSPIVEMLEYGMFAEAYTSLAADNYYWDVQAAASTNILATYAAFFADLPGNALTVFTSGFVEENPSFGVYVAFANGVVVPLPPVEVARVQLIQNTHAANIDVYLDGELIIDNYLYRSATPFVFFPAGPTINLGVAPQNSTTEADTIANFPVQLENGKSYVLVFNGIIGSTDFPPALAIQDMAQEDSSSPESVQVLAFHGAPQAPSFNISDFLDVPVITGFSYHHFTDGYIGLEAREYAFEVKPIASSDIVGTFLTDFSGQEGQSLVMLASGIEGSDPNFELLAIYPDGSVVPFLPVALGQFIHNSPSAVANVVDVWVNGEDKLIEDFSYLSATPVTFYPTRIPLSIGFAAPDSDTPEDIALSLEDPLTFEDGTYHVIIAHGLVGNTDTPFELARHTESTLFADFPPQVDATFFHGATGLGAIDVRDRESGALLTDGLEYAGFSEATGLEAAPDAYFLEIRPDDSEELLYTFYASLNPNFVPFSATVVATGAIESGLPLSLVAFDPLGNVQALTPVAEVQFINNITSDSLDAYANGGIFLDSFAYRAATPFLNAPTRANIEFAFTPGAAQSIADSLIARNIRFEDGKKYLLMLTGRAGDADHPVGLTLYDMAQTSAANDDEMDIIFHHGAIDAPAVDIIVEEGNTWFDDVDYAEYQGYLNIPPDNYSVQVTPADDNGDIIKTYDAGFSSYAGEAATIFTTGLLNTASPEEAFGLWVALEDGTTFPLSEIVSTEEVSALVSTLQISPNPVSHATRINYTLKKGTNVVECIFDANGKLLRHAVLGKQVPGEYARSLSIEHLPAGIYTYVLKVEKGVISRKFIVP